MTTTEPLFLKAAEAAKVLSISDRKLWPLTTRKQIPHVRINPSHPRRWQY